MKKLLKKKKPKKPCRQQIPEQSLGPIQIKKDALIAAMRALSINEHFKLLRSLWLDKRWRLIEAGKTAPSPEQWHTLKGFDEAVMECEKWSSMETREDFNGERANQLSESLS